MEVYSIWSEWDIGLDENDYFKTVEAAMNFLRSNAELLDLDEDQDLDDQIDELRQDGLVVIQKAYINIME